MDNRAYANQDSAMGSAEKPMTAPHKMSPLGGILSVGHILRLFATHMHRRCCFPFASVSL
jgi:hypothetical protein